MTAKELFAEMHPGRTIFEGVVKPLGMSLNALAKTRPRHELTYELRVAELETERAIKKTVSPRKAA